ncbi:Importin-5 [Trichostrongylus colubriformis]|uniref:Importin-5 n=1 Tax=Trichostrongylus colubriformis TaxID=6319 RepID=A0AAN8F1E1_TRICO
MKRRRSTDSSDSDAEDGGFDENRIIRRDYLIEVLTAKIAAIENNNMDLQQFNQLVVHMQSSDNEERSEAEKIYSNMDSAVKASLLFSLYCTADAPFESRLMCLVLLRRLLSSKWDQLWQDLGSQQKSFTDQLINTVMVETDTRLRKKLLAVVAEVARNTVDEDTGKQNWAEVLQFLEHCMASENISENEFVAVLLESVPNIFGSDQDVYVPRIKNVFSALFKGADAEIRSSAFKAFVTFIVENDDDDHLVRDMSPLMSQVVEVCRYTCTHDDGDDTPLQCLSELEAAAPKMVNPHLSNFLEMCIAKDDAYRHSATEVLATICEYSTAVLKKRYSQSIFFILKAVLLLMTHLNMDLNEWLEVDELDAEDDEESVAVGESALDRIACALNGKYILSSFVALTGKLRHSEDWRERHVALMGFSVIGEGCQRVMEPQIQSIVRELIPFLDDKHPRVRYAACNAIGQMSSDFAPTLQKKCHEWVVPALMSTLLDNSCDRVSAHAAAALINFCEDCPKQIIAAYLPAIMNGLEQALGNAFSHMQSTGKKLRCEQLLTAIASVADAAQDLFIEFYDRIVPNLKYILVNSTSDDHKVLRGKTLESLSLIGVAVGKEKFREDAIAIMNLLQDSMPTLTSDDPQCSYMICSWTRICKVLGKEFAPYLPMVMGPVLQTAAYKPDVAVLEEDQCNKDDPAWSYHSVGDNKSFGIRTAGLDEKADSCAMLVCYARDLEEEFMPYVDEVAQLSVQNLRFLFVDSVRCSAAETLPWLLKCVKTQGVELQRRLWVEFFPALCTALETENEVEVVESLVDSLAECVLQLGAAGLTNEDVEKIAGVISEQIKEHEKRRMEAEAEEAEEDADVDDLKDKLSDEAEMEGEVLARISDLIHNMFETFGECFFDCMEPLLPEILQLIDIRRPYPSRQYGLCYIDDCIEFAPKRCAQYQDQYVPVMLKCLADEYPEVRQAAAYGFGIMGMIGGADYLNSVTSALEPLAAMVNNPEARSTDESSGATDNGIAAVAKILKYSGANIDIAQVVPAFLSWLPTHEDVTEAPHIYGYLADLIESDHPVVLGKDNCNLPRLVFIIVSAFALEAFPQTEEGTAVAQRLQHILKVLHNNAEVFEAVVQAAQLDEKRTETLRGLIS